jgi:hypothetical protein
MLNAILQEQNLTCGLHLTSSRQIPISRFCKHGDEPSASTKLYGFNDQLKCLSIANTIKTNTDYRIFINTVLKAQKIHRNTIKNERFLGG